MESITRLEDIKAYNVSYRPRGNRPALWDCPNVIRDAAYGKAPIPKLWSQKEYLRLALPVVVLLGVTELLIGMTLLANRSLLIMTAPAWISIILLVIYGRHDLRKDYERAKEIFDAYRAHPDLYRDEVFKAAVGRLPRLDFHGRHLTPVDKAMIGRYEQDIISFLGTLGIRQEYTIANRDRPFLIHQYELKELRWGKRPDGSSKNYVPDIAILWPERRIKFNIEIDGPSHAEPRQFQRDMKRDGILTKRGWFVRRFNHQFIASGIDDGKLYKALTEVVQIIYFFAKYADNEPLGWDSRIDAWASQRKYRMLMEQAQQEAAAPAAVATSR